MSHKAPFVAHFRIVPYRNKRYETIRAMQRLAKFIYSGADGTTGLLGNANLSIAAPGGGQHMSFSDNQNSMYQDGLAIKPQFGETPAQLMIAGFYLLSTANDLPHAEKTVTHVGEYITGAGGAQPYRSNPTATVAAEVVALKAIFDAVLAAEVPGEGVTLFRLEYKGIIFGDRGYTYPA